MSIAVHRDTIQRGKDYLVKRKAAVQMEKAEEEREISLAEAAQAALPSQRH